MQKPELPKRYELNGLTNDRIKVIQGSQRVTISLPYPLQRAASELAEGDARRGLRDVRSVTVMPDSIIISTRRGVSLEKGRQIAQLFWSQFSELLQSATKGDGRHMFVDHDDVFDPSTPEERLRNAMAVYGD